MTAAALDPAATITAAGRELVDELTRLAERGGPVDELLDAIGKLTGRIRRRINSARKAQAAETAKPAPKPAAGDKPATKAGEPKPATPARTTVPAKTTPPAATVPLKPAPKSATRKDTHAHRPKHARPKDDDRGQRQRRRRTRQLRTHGPEQQHMRRQFVQQLRPVLTRQPRLVGPAVPWPVLLVAAVMGLITVLAGVGWAPLGGAITAAALLLRAHWPRLTRSTRLKIKPRGNPQ